MLSDHERETLREIQRQLVVEDPDFERSFHTLAEQPAGPAESSGPAGPTASPPAEVRWAYTVVIVVALLLAAVSLIAGSLGGMLAFGLVAGTVRFAQYLEKAATHGQFDD